MDRVFAVLGIRSRLPPPLDLRADGGTRTRAAEDARRRARVARCRRVLRLSRG